MEEGFEKKDKDSLFGWKAARQLHGIVRDAQAKNFEDIARKIAKSHGKEEEWIKEVESVGNRSKIIYHPELISLLEQRKVVPAGDWKSASGLSIELKSSPYTVARDARKVAKEKDRSDWIEERSFGFGGSKIAEAYHPDLINILKEMNVPDAGDWVSGVVLAKILHSSKGVVEVLARETAENQNLAEQWIGKRKFRGTISEAYHPDLVKFLMSSIVKEAGDWLSAGILQGELRTNKESITETAIKIATEHGKLKEWIEDRRAMGHLVAHFHPDLVALLRVSKIKDAGDWQSIASLSSDLGTTVGSLHKRAIKIATEHNKLADWIEDRLNKSRISHHYHPDLVDLLKMTKVKAAGDWKSGAVLEREGMLGSGRKIIHEKAVKIATEHKKLIEWIEDRSSRGKIAEHYHPDLIALLRESKQKDAGDWISVGLLEEELRSLKSTIHQHAVKIATEHGKNIEWIEERRGRMHVSPHYHPDLTTLLRASKPEDAGDWMSIGDLKKILKSDSEIVYANARRIASEHGKLTEWIGKRRRGRNDVPHFHPDLVALLIDSNPKDADDWMSARMFGKQFNVGRKKIHDRAVSIATAHGKLAEWIGDRRKKGQVTIHYHPDLLVLLRDEFGYFIDEEKKERLIENNVNEFFNSNLNKSNSEMNQFKALVRLFGSSRAIDLLYKFRPDFKGVSADYIKSCLGEYLGDFLVIKHEFNLKDLGAAAEFLSETTFREGLYETMKDHCLQYYFEQRKKGVQGDSYEIVYGYLVHITDELQGVSNKSLDDVIEDVVSYFNSAIQEFHKPEKFVERLSEDREFPDLNQRINMKELKDKKRMLIADGMGLGKSASVIMAKEHMNLGCALVIVPKVVEGTWQNYLSDDPVKKGYFKPGQAPRVLIVKDIKDLQGVTNKDYDYIIISQAKLNGRYAPLLMELDPDILIVDESHKFKKTGGVRSEVLLPLARKLEGEGKYLALLTGTPIPNKVRDIAITLKLLYPERFGDMPNTDLVRNIIHGDLVDLRSLLIPRMQMKELEDVIDMPDREQKITTLSMSRAEADVYEALLELDELTAFEKTQTLRKFLLYPQMLEVSPDIQGVKFQALQSEVTNAFKTKSKVMVVVNDFVSGIMRGKEFLFQQLDLPSGVKIEFIHGDDGSSTDSNLRPDLQNRFNNSNEKILLVVSGGAAGVGISLVGAEETIIYNETWTEADLKQQKARVFRPGLLHAIIENTFIVGNTIEQGMHEYIAKKHKAIEKILKGIPLSELEKQMVEKAENKKEGEPPEIDFEVNPELARHYFSWKTRLTQMFGHTKELGEEAILKFFETWGEDYAEGYRQVGARSYQANTNRVAGTLIDEMIQKSGRHAAAIQILDVASGPEMLRRHIGNSHQASVHSLDINGHHFKDSTSSKTSTGSWTKMPFKSRSFDYLNCAMAFQDSAFVPSKQKYERLNVLREMNRVLKPGGRAAVSMIYSMQMRDMDKFKLFAEATGFHVVQDFTGLAENGAAFSSQVITLEKFADVEKTAEDIVKEVGFENVEGLKMRKSGKTVRNDREILTGFLFDGKAKIADLNDSDRAVVREEKEITDQVAELKRKFGSIKEIPPQEIINQKFVRILVSKKYHLFKRLTKAPGVVILK